MGHLIQSGSHQNQNTRGRIYAWEYTEIIRSNPIYYSSHCIVLRQTFCLFIILWVTQNKKYSFETPQLRAWKALLGRQGARPIGSRADSWSPSDSSTDGEADWPRMQCARRYPRRRTAWYSSPGPNCVLCKAALIKTENEQDCKLYNPPTLRVRACRTFFGSSNLQICLSSFLSFVFSSFLTFFQTF